jgi:hypothetical protein
MNVDHGVVDIQVFVRDACANTAGAKTRTARKRRGMSAAWKRTDQRTWVTGKAERRSAEKGSGSRQEGKGNFLHGFVSCGGLKEAECASACMGGQAAQTEIDRRAGAGRCRSRGG